MNVYDLAHELAKAMADSDEYKGYLEAKKVVEADETNSKMVNDFHKMEIKKINDMYQLISMNQTVKDFLDSEMRLSTMISDVFKIINDAIGEVAE